MLFTPGPEFQVNTSTQDAQLNSAVTALSDGGFVVVWMSLGHGVYAQRYDSTGDPVEQEFRVNTTTNTVQDLPAVVGLANGGYVITWQGHSTLLQQSDEVFARLYDPSGNAVGSEFLVNSYVQNLQDQSSVTALASGGFVVTWTSQQGATGNDVFAKIYGADGVPVTGDVRVNTSLTADQQVSSVASLPDGGFVVVWVSSASGTNDIYGQRFDSGGNAVGVEFQVSEYTTGTQTDPSVANLAGGGFLVAWASDGQDGDRFGVYARLYAADGTPVGDEFRVNTYTTNYQFEPSVSGLANGSFIVTWTSNGQDGADYGVYGQVFDADGTPDGTEFLINSQTVGGQGHPSVVALPQGGFVAAWSSYPQDGSDQGVYAKVFIDPTPVLTTSTGATAFVESGDVTVTFTPVVIDGAITVSDADSATLASATVTITNYVAGQDLLRNSRTHQRSAASSTSSAEC